jgi:hypothetical protein
MHGRLTHPGFDDGGATSAIEYILTFIMASLIFSLFINNPQYVVTRNQLADIGNDVSTKVIDTYLVAPNDGKVITYFDIPGRVAAGNTYQIDVVQSGIDRELSVYTDDRHIYVNNTLNGASITIPIKGNTASVGRYHYIVFDKETGEP